VFVVDLELSRIRARKRQRTLLTNLLVYVVLVAVAILSIYPFLWTFVTSLETAGGIFEFPPKLVPQAPSWRNYAAVLELVPIARQFLNSLIISFFGVFLSVLFCTLAAYPLAKMEFPGRNFIFYAILATLVLPNEAGLIVNYVTTAKLGLLKPELGAFGQFAAIILPALPSTVGLFLMRQAYLSVPSELLEAARIDGASELLIWRRIMLPLAMPTIVAFSILQFVAIWNSFLWPVIILRDRELYPLAAGLLDLAGTFATNTRAVSAGAVIQIIPILIIFFIFQRYFMRGLEGAVKG
jgi:putative chitobiose transport system permease protein